MTMIVYALIATAMISAVVGMMTYMRLVRAMKRHGLTTPDPEGDNSWMWASYPPEVHRLRVWNIACIVVFVGCIAAAAVLTQIFDLCPDCASVRRTSSPP